jgi:hypothetical protein
MVLHMATRGIAAQMQLTAEGRRAEVARMMLSGEVIDREELAKRFGVVEATIARDVRVIREQWRGESLQAGEALVAQDMAELGMVKREAWRVYEESLHPRVAQTEQTTVSGGLGEGGAGKRQGPGQVKSESKTVSSPTPNLKALDLVVKCMDRRRKLLGYGDDGQADAPKAIRFTVKIGDRVLEAGTGRELDEGEIEDAEFTEMGSLAAGDGDGEVQ